MLLLLLPLTAAAQDEEQGFFGRLLGGGDETEEGGGFLERQLEGALSSAGREVTVTGFQGALSSRASIEQMTIADEEGVWLTLRDVVLDWNRSALLRRRIEISELSAGEILLPRLPMQEQAGVDVPPPEAQGFSLPELPVAIQIGVIEAERVELGEPLFGEAAVVSLAGEMRLAGGEGAVDIQAERIDDEEGTLSLDASYANETRELALDLDLTEGENGIVANLIDLPGRPSLRLSVAGAGPLTEFDAEIGLWTDGEQRLDGTVALGEAEGGGVSFAADIGGDIAPVFLPEYREFFGDEVALEVAGATLPEGGVRVESLNLAADALRLRGELVVGADGLPDLVDLSGRIGDAGGDPVLLPLAGVPTRVDSATLDVAFDASESEDWELDLTVSGLDREGFDAAQIVVGGTGRISADPRSVTADLEFAATDLSLADGGAQEALGERVTGQAEFAWTEGEPLDIPVLTIRGETYELDAAGQVAFGEAMTVEGRATLAARDLSAFSGLAQRPLAGSAELSLTGSGDPLAGQFDVTVDGTTEDLQVGVSELDPLLAGTGTLTLRTARSEAGTQIEEFRIETPELVAQGEGVLATGASELELTASVEDTSLIAASLEGPAAVDLSAAQTGDDWTFDVDASGSGAEIAAEGRVEGLGLDPVVSATFDVSAANLGAFSGLAGRPLAGSLTAEGEGRTSFDLRRAAIDATIGGEGLQIGDPRIDPLLEGGAVDVTVDATRSGDVLRIDAFRLESPDAEVTAEGRVESLTVAPVFDGAVTVTSPDLAAFSGLAGRELGGAVDAEASGSLAFDLSRFDLTVEATAEDLEPGVPGAAAALAGETTLALEASREGERVEVTRLALANPQVTASGSGVVTELETTPVFDGTLSVASPDLAAFSELAERELGGAVDAEATGSLAFDLSRFDLAVEATAEDLEPGVPGAAAALAGETTLALEASREGERVEVARLALANPQVTASGSGVVTALATSPAFDGTLSVASPDLGAFSELAGRELGGAVEAEFEGAVASDLSALDAVLTAEGRDLDFGLPGGALFPGEATLSVAARREGDTVILSELSLDSANLTAEGAGEVRQLETTPVFDGQLAASADTIAPFGGLVGRELAGAVTAGVSGAVAADLSTFDLSVDAEAQGLAIGQDDLDRLLAGTTTVDIDATRADGVTTIEAAEIDAPGFDLSATGTLGEAGAEVELSAQLADIGPYAPGFSGPVTVEGAVAQSDGALRLDLQAGGPGGIAVSVAGTVDPSAPTVDLAIEGQAPLAAANRFVQPRALDGTLRFDLAMQGAPGLDALSGTVTTSEARFVDPTFGIVLENIDLTGQLGAGRLSVDGDATVQAGGSVSVSGSVGLSGNLPADLDVALNEAVLQDPELYRTSVTGSVAFDGPLRGGGSITGDLTLGETELRVPSTGAGAGGPIPEIEHVGESAAVRATRERAGLLRETMDGTETLRERRRVAHSLDVTVSAPNRIFVRGRGLDAELGGTLRIGGTTTDVVPSGQFDLIRGRLDILGQRLVLDEGSIRLQGDFVPTIRLVAATETEDTNVFVVVEGRLTQPEINFLSEPELPEDEVLARLLFGRSIEDISALQAAQLASAIATLTGRGNGIISQLRQGFGLDDLDITTGEDGGTALRAGRYLSENIYTDVTIDSEGETQLNLNLDVTESLTVKGGVDNAGDSSIGIFFERDY